jgi:catechol 2,3-dioxygenase-like lactoylglutathione lyase family enzyme
MGDTVQAKIFSITLAVDDLDRSVAFYRDGLGWPTEGIVERIWAALKNYVANIAVT